ncbi:hypothetical protein [Chitinimonas sp.]|uniref:hypothetical protein n=1 Tax=Chitinimonas sp. TaxID=1934313 RepID=UPI002F93F8BA
MHTKIALLLALIGATSLALADNPPQGGRPPGPPPIDTASCAGKAVGTATQITTPDGRVLKGTCQLAFVPDFKDAPPPPSGAK